MSEIHYQSIESVGALLKRSEISSLEITRHLLERIERLDGELNAYATVLSDDALVDAARADRAIATGLYRGPLHGVPIALKDLCMMRGSPTRAGMAVREHLSDDIDASVVTRLRAAGAVILGKLNLAEGAMAAYNPKFAAPVNPWDKSLSTGGSSSGSGVATAAGLCFGSLGTDTGGSIRFPASQCGVVGVKPSWGRVSRHGVLDLAPSMDHVGPLTRTVNDAAIMLDAIAGFDARDVTSLALGGTTLATAPTSVDGLRIGYAERYSTEGVHEETVTALGSALDALTDQGARRIDIEIPTLDDYVIAWRDICTVEAVIAHEEFFPSHAAEYGPWFRSWLAYGAALGAREYALAHENRLKCNALIAHAFAEIDVLICPAMATPEQRKSDAEFFDEPMGEFNAARQRFTIPYNFNGAPSITLPVGFNTSGAPLSVQCIGKHGREDQVFAAAAAVEESLEHRSQHPAI